MGERTHIYLSYRSSEVNFALKLGADLKNAGVNLWMDRLDIQPGDDWNRGIHQALLNSVAIIPVLSPAYVASEYCRQELIRINRMGRLVIPVVLHSVLNTEWLLEIEQESFTDFSLSGDTLFYQNQLGKLIQILKHLLPNQVHSVPDPKLRYVMSLMAEIESSKGLISHIETSTGYEDTQVNLDVRPQPVVGQTWFLHGRYALDVDQSRKQQPSILSGIYTAVDNYPRFVLLGQPGVGKTLTIKSLVLDAIRQYRKAPLAAPLPLYIDLHQWIDRTNPIQLIRNQWPLRGDPIDLMMKGRVALYMDGLNEMSQHPGSDSKYRMLREWLMSQYAPQQVVISCRSEAYDDRMQLGLPVVRALDLDGTYLQRFVEYYLEEDEARYFLSNVTESTKQGLSTAILPSGLSRNLFLLSASLLMYKVSPDRETLYNAGPLMSRIVRALWDSGQNRTYSEGVSFESVESVLIDLAILMVDAGLPIYISHEKAIEAVGSQSLLNAAIEANLLEQDAGEIRFPHELLKNYFAALGLQYIGLPTRLSRPEFDSTYRRVPQRWDPVITMLVGIVPNPDSMILSIAEVDPYLALQCVFSGVHLEERTYKTVVKQQLEMMKTDGDYRVAMAHILIGSDNNRATLILLEALRDGEWLVREAAMTALKRIHIQPLTEVVEALDKLEDSNREETLAALCLLGTDVVPTLLHLLGATHWHTRRGAVWALGALKERASVPFLIEILEDVDHAVSAEAATSLGLLKDTSAIPSLIRALAHPHWQVSRAAARALAHFGEAAVSGLIEVLKNRTSSTGQRVRAIEALAHIKHVDAGIAVLKMTRSRDVEERYTAVKALKYHMTQAATRRLVECLSDEAKPRWTNQRICDLAAGILESSGTKEVSSVVDKWRQRQLRRAKPTSNEPSGKRVKERLRRVMHPSTTLDVGVSTPQAVNDRDWIVRRDAIAALVGESAVVALPHLMSALSGDEESQVRAAAAQSLIRFKDDERVLPALVRALYDEDILVCDAARDAIKQIGQLPLDRLLEIIQSENLNVRAAAIDIAGATGDEDAVPYLIEALADIRTLWLSDQRICDIAAQALEAVGTPTALEAADQWRNTQTSPLRHIIPVPESVDKSRDILNELLEGLHNEDWTIRQETAKSLRDYAQFSRGIPDSLFIQPLTDALSDPDWIVRWAATEALAWIRDSAPVAALAVLVDDPNWMVRSAAVRALMEIGDPTSVDSVARGLVDSNAMVREAAAEALGVLGDSGGLAALTGVLGDDEQLVRLAAIKSLGLLRDPAAIQSLHAQLFDSDTVSRWYVAEALWKIAHPSAIPALVPLLEDTGRPHWEEQRVCDVASNALEAINTPDALAAVEEWRQRMAAHS